MAIGFAAALNINNNIESLMPQMAMSTKPLV